MQTRAQGLTIALLTMTAALGTTAGMTAGATPSSAATTIGPGVEHVFVVNLENKGFDTTFGPNSPAPYLSTTLPSQGQLLTQYFGTAHNSQPNYVAQISGQGPNAQMQGDCQTYSDFVQTGTVAPDQAVGSGCVFPPAVKNIANQMETHGLTWKGYMEDMGTPCRHPQLNSADDTQQAQVGDQYAARHNPFVYFHSIIDSPTCAEHDVDLSQLPTDLVQVSSTPNLSYITPNLCDDGHDSPCVDGRPGGLVSADAWLKTWVPKILASPAYQQDGLLVITFDEADTSDTQHGADACCGEGPGPNAALPGIYGPGGGRTGAVLLSPFITPGTVNDTGYNHYSVLRYLEDTFGLPALGYAQNARGFGSDVFGAGK